MQGVTDWTALLFERLWHEVGCRAVLEELAAAAVRVCLPSARYS